ncbi:hypothetical protein ACH5RR_011663 [Cinchona calisaya]|uniref:Transmembrane protein n=1 Tax=Cinchona calisaya TaxID=153742 RepID=A0ABD3A5M2_9GENT
MRCSSQSRWITCKKRTTAFTKSSNDSATESTAQTFPILIVYQNLKLLGTKTLICIVAVNLTINLIVVGLKMNVSFGYIYLNASANKKRRQRVVKLLTEDREHR